MTLRVSIAVLLISMGLLVIAISVFGLFRLRDALERIHAGALTDTLGLMLVVGGIVTLCGITVHSGKLLLLLALLWFTNPVSSHLLVRMELITGRDIDPDELEGKGEMEL